MSIVTALAALGLAVIATAALTPHRKAASRRDGTASAEPPVLACRLGALTSEERTRHHDLRVRLEGGTVSVEEDADGYTFHYAADVAPVEVIAWIELERKCCPFLRFTLHVPEDDGPSSLRIWGVPGVRAFLAAELQVVT